MMHFFANVKSVKARLLGFGGPVTFSLRLLSFALNFPVSLEQEGVSFSKSSSFAKHFICAIISLPNF